jgi:hypothetical protein
MGVTVAKAELNNTAHLCSNKGLPLIFCLCGLVVAKAELNNSVHPLYTWPAATVWHNIGYISLNLTLLENDAQQHHTMSQQLSAVFTPVCTAKLSNSVHGCS